MSRKTTLLILACGAACLIAGGFFEDDRETESALSLFETEVGFHDQSRWFSVEYSRSVVTETRRRVFVNKEAATQALLNHGGGNGFEAQPIEFPAGTTFVAESLSPEGKRLDTEVLVVRHGKNPDFLLFDEQGNTSDTFAQPNDPPRGPSPGNVPRVCLGCHAGNNYFEPTMSFPQEPRERRVSLPQEYRDREVVLHFLEAFHRGGGLFGPYASIWLARLRADARLGRLSESDRPWFDLLAKRYPRFLGPE